MRPGFLQVLVSLIAVSWCLLSVAPGWGETPTPPEELYRIRVLNAVGGPIAVSSDRGATYVTVGKVTQPATGLVPGFAASRWAADSAIAAVAVHGLRIKVRTALPRDPHGGGGTVMMSLVPREFRKPPKGYASHMPAKSGIYTDIPAGEGIFRNLAPFVGNPVRLERDGKLVPFPPAYVPAVGDRLVILAVPPPDMPREIVFENWKSGIVTALYDGRDPQPIARVLRPFLGVGRYDATTYTGVGRINTNHTGVITISTASTSGSLLPEGEGSERRGGIQIEPSNHAQDVSYDAPQVMVVGPLEGHAAMEGQPPLFSGYIGLFWDRRSPERSVTAEVKIDNGPWEALPEAMGRIDDFFTAPSLNRYFQDRGMTRHITSGVTHLRLLFPRLNAETVAAYLAPYQAGGSAAVVASGTGPAAASGGSGSHSPVKITPTPNSPSGSQRSGPTTGASRSPGTGGAVPAAESRVTGIVTLNVALKNVADPGRVALMSVYVDGRLVAIMNTPPFRQSLDTRRFSNGSHEIELRATDAQGGIVVSKKTTVLVDNAAAVPASESGKQG